MNKKIFLYGIALALFVMLVNSAFATADVTNVVNPSVAVTPGQTASGSFTLTDTADGDGDDITAFVVTSGNLVGVSDNTKTIAFSAISIPSFTTVSDDSSGSVSFNIVVPNDLTLIGQTYTGDITFTATETAGMTPEVVSLTVTVKSPLEVQNFDNSNALEILGEEGADGLSASFSVKNIGTTSLAGLTFVTSTFDLTDGDESATLTFAPTSITSINAGATASTTVNVDFEDNLDLDTYGGILSIVSGNTVLDTFKIDLIVHPELCEDGVVNEGNVVSRSVADLEIDIKDPDNNDDFKIGDEIAVEVKVKNDGNEDLDVVVEAILYNLDENEDVVTVESDADEVKDGKSETFEFDLEIPSSTDLDEDDSYVLFIKAFEDGNEDEYCNWDSINMDFEREKNDVVVEEAELLPSSVNPGDTIEIRVKAQNQGTKDQDDVSIKLLNNELGLSLTSNKFDLDKAGDKDEDIVKRFSFTVPKTVQARDYLIEVSILDEDDDVYDNGQEFVTLTVKGEGTPTVSEFGVRSLSTDIATGSSVLNLVLTNSGSNNAVATVEFNAVGGWANDVSKVVNLQPGDNNVALDLNVNKDANGAKSATVNIKTAVGNEIKTQSTSLSFNVVGDEKISESGSNFFSGENSTLFWILGDIVLVIVAIFFIRAIFFGKKTQ